MKRSQHKMPPSRGRGSAILKMPPSGNGYSAGEQLTLPGWVRSSVGEIFKVVGGGTPPTSRSELWNGPIPWITSADIDEHHHIYPRRTITQAAIANSATNLVPRGSAIVVTRVGLGKVGLAPIDICFSQDSQALLFSPDLLDPWYVAHYMGQAVSVFRQIGRGTTISGVTKKQLIELPFLIAPLREQRRIVAEIEKQFTRLEAAVGALKSVQANLKRYRASVLKAACEGRLVPTEAELARAEKRPYEPADKLLARILKERRAHWEADQLAKMQAAGRPPKDDKWKAKYKEPAPPDTANLSPLPEGWAWATAAQLTTLITSGSRNWSGYTSRSGPLFIRAQDIRADRLDFGGVARVDLPRKAEGIRTLVRQDDILVTITGANVTKSARVCQHIPEAYVSQHVGLVRLASSDISAYVYYWIVAPSYGRRVLEQTAYGAGKPGLNLDNLRELGVALPPLTEQTRIVAELERRLSVIDELEATVEANLKRAVSLRQAILKRAFEGKLVPQDPTDEPASILLERIQGMRGANISGEAPAEADEQASAVSREGLSEKQKNQGMTMPGMNPRP